MEKIDFFAKWILRFSILGSLIYTLITGHWVGTAGGTLVLIGTFIGDYINKKHHKINPLITAMIYIYCLFSLVMGNMWDFYDKIVWWDLLMHVLSGVILGTIGNTLIKKEAEKNQISKITRFLFIVGVACIGGVFWEIYEFTIDSLFKLDTQLVRIYGISDTMWDLILDFIGGVGIGIFFSFYGKKK